MKKNTKLHYMTIQHYDICKKINETKTRLNKQPLGFLWFCSSSSKQFTHIDSF